MKVIDALLDILLLRSLRRRLREWHRTFTFNRAMRVFVAQPDRVFDTDDPLLDRLLYGWGNISYSAEHEFLRASLRSVQQASDWVLECGSGLSTVLAGALAQKHGVRVWTLEHHPFWAERVRSALREHKIDTVRMDVTPLRRYADFDWYDPSFDAMPEQFSAVLCDGPPGDTRGGRHGFLPVMRARLAPECVILVDDADRQAERDIAGAWAAELGTKMQVKGERKPYIDLRMPIAVRDVVNQA